LIERQVVLPYEPVLEAPEVGAAHIHVPPSLWLRAAARSPRT
jgi:hypothetical protein